MKLNRLIVATVVGISLLAPSTSAFACEHDSHSWSFFGWCNHDEKDKDKDCDHKDRDCDHHDRDRGHDCDHDGGGSTGSTGHSTGGGGSTGGGSSTGGGTVGPKG
jgi:uncharacterized membrane protein YgcG